MPMNNSSTFLYVRNDFDNNVNIEGNPVQLLEDIDYSLSNLFGLVEESIPEVSKSIIKNILDFAHIH